eukprot:scaffold100981_cov31-Tisochrysis_lutea.AAC.3
MGGGSAASAQRGAVGVSGLRLTRAFAPPSWCWCGTSRGVPTSRAVRYVAASHWACTTPRRTRQPCGQLWGPRPLLPLSLSPSRPFFSSSLLFSLSLLYLSLARLSSALARLGGERRAARG